MISYQFHVLCISSVYKKVPHNTVIMLNELIGMKVDFNNCSHVNSSNQSKLTLGLATQEHRLKSSRIPEIQINLNSCKIVYTTVTNSMCAVEFDNN